MKSLQHVLWRGALALSLMAAGIGSGLGMPQVERPAPAGICPTEARLLATAGSAPEPARAGREAPALLRRPPSPAG